MLCRLFTRRLPWACRVGHNLASMKKWKKAADPGSGREANPGEEAPYGFGDSGGGAGLTGGGCVCVISRVGAGATLL